MMYVSDRIVVDTSSLIRMISDILRKFKTRTLTTRAKGSSYLYRDRCESFDATASSRFHTLNCRETYSLLVTSMFLTNSRLLLTLSCGEMLCSIWPTLPPGSTITCERSTRMPSLMELPK